MTQITQLITQLQEVKDKRAKLRKEAITYIKANAQTIISIANEPNLQKRINLSYMQDYSDKRLIELIAVGENAALAQAYKDSVIHYMVINKSDNKHKQYIQTLETKLKKYGVNIKDIVRGIKPQ